MLRRASVGFCFVWAVLALHTAVADDQLPAATRRWNLWVFWIVRIGQ